MSSTTPPELPESLDAPTIRALTGAGYTNLIDLAGATREGVLALHGIGPKVLVKLETLMASEGLTFAEGGHAR